MYQDDEINFVKAVLYLTNINTDITDSERDLIRKTRMQKLVCYVADMTDFPLTRGWFKHGRFSPVVCKVYSDSSSDEKSLKEVYSDDFIDAFNNFKEKYPDLENEILDTILKILPIIRNPDVDELDMWAHEAYVEQFGDDNVKFIYDFDKKFRNEAFNFYSLIEEKNKRDIILDNILNIYPMIDIDNFDIINVINDYFIAYREISDKISFIDNDKKNEIYEKMKDKLYNTYVSKDNIDILTLISRYHSSLIGLSSNYVKDTHITDINCTLPLLEEKINDIKEYASNNNLLYSIEEAEMKYNTMAY